MRTIIILVIFVCSHFYTYSQSTVIQSIVQEVQGDSLFATIADLQQMDRVTSSNSQEPPTYLKKRLANYEVDTIFYHYYNANTPPNVVGIKIGKQFPDEYYIIGAHYDAVLPGAGADDNASGTSAVIEMARVLKDYDIKRSLIYILFSDEESGMNGSKAFADSAISAINISGMINLDMIGYSHNNEDSSVSVCWKYFAAGLLADFIDASSQYVPELIVEPDSTSLVLYSSDHSSFWKYKIPAIFLIENSDFTGGAFNPYYHKFSDTIGQGANSPWLAEKTARAAIATLLAKLEPYSTAHVAEVPKSMLNATLYPNPATSKVTISIDEFAGKGENFSIEIYDRHGKQLSLNTKIKNNSALDISWLPKGIYIVMINSSSYTEAKKLIKL